MANLERTIAARGPQRARCPGCSASGAPEADRCGECAADRPSAGWKAVAELVLHDGGRSNTLLRPGASSEPQLHTVPSPSVPAPRTVPLRRLAAVFAAAFLATQAVVLGVWGVLHDRPAVAVPAEPAPAPSLPSLSGPYVGQGDAQPMTLDLQFLPEGVLAATIARTGAGSASTLSAEGRYTLDGRTATILLVERGVAVPLLYSGTVTDGVAEGRVTAVGRADGRFRVQK